MTPDTCKSARYRLTALLLAAVSGVALTASAAFADETQGSQGIDPALASQLASQIEQIKAQLEALESRQASSAQFLKDYNSISIARGSDLDGSFDHLTRRGDEVPGKRGFTIAISPTADLPAPVHEITVAGYVKGDVIYDFDQDLGDSFAFSTASPGKDEDHIRLHARQTRFSIRSKSDTSVGQIRTLIEGDFFGASQLFRMRHAWGEWDMAPGWTFGTGQTWSNFMLLFDLPDTIDFFGPAGLAFKRQGQVRLTYRSGPMLIAVAVEDPTSTLTSVPGLGPVVDSTERVPDFTGRVEYTTPNNYKVALSGVVGETRLAPHTGFGSALSSDSEIFWGVIGGVQIPVLDWITLTASGGYGDGNARYLDGADVANNVFGLGLGTETISSREFFHIAPSVAVSLTETVTLNAAWGYIDFDGSDTVAGETDHVQSVHGNVLWQPVPQLKMGVEVMWAEREIKGVGEVDLVRAQFGTWFFF